jgi:fatty acid desaturase
MMLIATSIAWRGFFIIISNFDPQEANWMVFSLFYFVLFLGFVGALSLIGFLLRSLQKKKRALPRLMAMESFRQGFIFAACLIVALWLQAGRVLTWWNMILLVILATVVEFSILVFRQSTDNKSNT